MYFAARNSQTEQKKKKGLSHHNNPSSNNSRQQISVRHIALITNIGSGPYQIHIKLLLALSVQLWNFNFKNNMALKANTYLKYCYFSHLMRFYVRVVFSALL